MRMSSVTYNWISAAVPILSLYLQIFQKLLLAIVTESYYLWKCKILQKILSRVQLLYSFPFTIIASFRHKLLSRTLLLELKKCNITCLSQLLTSICKCRDFCIFLFHEKISLDARQPRVEDAIAMSIESKTSIIVVVPMYYKSAGLMIDERCVGQIRRMAIYAKIVGVR